MPSFLLVCTFSLKLLMPNEFQSFHVVMCAFLHTTFLTSFWRVSLQSHLSHVLPEVKVRLWVHSLRNTQDPFPETKPVLETIHSILTNTTNS